MKLYSIIGTDSCIHEIWRTCGANENSYPIQDAVSRLNAALDRFFHLAFQADGRWNFDDINEASPPIDTQNLVLGINRYKIGTFTEKVINVIRIEILSSAAKGLHLQPETFDNLGRLIGNESGRIGGSSGDTFQDLYVDASSGTPTHYCKYGDFIYLRPNPNYNETDGLKIYFNRPASKFDFLRFTVTEANPGVFTTASAHGMAVNDLVVFNTNGTIPTGITANTIYYIKTAPSTTTFTIASTLGGTAIEITDAQTTSVHICLNASKVPGIPEIYHPYLARHASLPFLIEKSLPNKNDIMKLIGSDNPRDPFYGGDELAIAEYFANRNKDLPNRMIPKIENCK